MKVIILALSALCLLISCLRTGECQEPDTLIQRLVGEISDSIYTGSVQRLQDFHTRYELSDSIGPAGQWIHDRFLSYGYTEVLFDSFSWTPTVTDTPIVSRNILAVKPGNSEPESLVILGGHYDSINYAGSYVDPNAPAPGANDNASGIAGVLEIARILAPYAFEKTIVFGCFAGEEVGMGGSTHYVSTLQGEGTPVRFSLVLDMIGYQADPFWDVLVDADLDYLDDALRTVQLGWLYSDRLRPHITFDYFGSDQWVLEEIGPALLIIEDAGYYDPNYHTDHDLLDSLNIPYATEILRMALASVVDVAGFSTAGIGREGPGQGTMIPVALSLHQNFPNPFNPATTIAFEVPGTEGIVQPTSLTIYDLHGKRIRTLVDSVLSPGPHRLVWDGKDARGEPVPSGIYLYALKAGPKASTRKMVLAK